ncbi:DUF4956 domain-containing protein [Mangrovibacterium lignilyticum]|uniref:DUF4956 domain-containing protein n=1 Tax=Mangrovibacterium lignilyticum TaxID=2668052 RepID=UPI0013D64A00|nr:DUF4956 domain-containing protein [Mangrovibacterium lignilyticum]
MNNILLSEPLQTPLFFDSAGFLDLLIRFTFNLLITFVIVRLIYYRKTKRKDYLFTYFLINTMIFLLAYLLSGVELKLGFAFGLFALFGILRYRTNPLQIKEMTYLFIIIGIAVVNSISDADLPYAEVFMANALIIGLLWVLEFAFRLSHESSKKILYERIELINQNREEELLKDLRIRTGINIHRIEVSSINFLRDTARLVVYYYEKNKIFNAEDQNDSNDSDN